MCLLVRRRRCCSTYGGTRDVGQLREGRGGWEERQRYRLFRGRLAMLTISNVRLDAEDARAGKEGGCPSCFSLLLSVPLGDTFPLNQSIDAVQAWRADRRSW